MKKRVQKKDELWDISHWTCDSQVGQLLGVRCYIVVTDVREEVSILILGLIYDKLTLYAGLENTVVLFIWKWLHAEICQEFIELIAAVY